MPRILKLVPCGWVDTAPTDLEAIDTRMQVRTAIMEGKVQEALAIIKERDEKVGTTMQSSCRGGRASQLVGHS